LPQPGNVNIHGARGGHRVVTPYLVQKLVTVDDPLGILREELQQAVWRPDVGLSGSVGLRDASTYSLGASISFSPADIKDEEREDLNEAIDEKLVDIEVEQFDLGLQKRLIVQNISIVEQALEAASLAEEQAAPTLRESELLMLYILDE
jgi:hypothetical protein